MAEACREHCSAHPSRPCASEYHASCLSQEGGEVGVAVAIREQASPHGWREIKKIVCHRTERFVGLCCTGRQHMCGKGRQQLRAHACQLAKRHRQVWLQHFWCRWHPIVRLGELRGAS
eukprot:scaffold27114_cov36-Phaeocystis_antarctica.AAC.1